MSKYRVGDFVEFTVDLPRYKVKKYMRTQVVANPIHVGASFAWVKGSATIPNCPRERLAILDAWIRPVDQEDDQVNEKFSVLREKVKEEIS